MIPSFTISRATRESRVAAGIALLAVIALATGPWWMERNSLRLAGEVLVYMGLASLWNLLAGYGGLVSVGQQAYVGLGSYVLFACAILIDLPPLAAVPLAGLAAGLLALPISVLVFRLRGAYFAIGTWVAAEVVRLGAAQVTVLGGGSGVSLPIAVVRSIGSSREMREIAVYSATLAVTLAILAGIFLITRSRWGLALQAIRDNELAAQTCGVDITATKRLLYVAAAAGAAMLGALVSLAKLRITPDSAFSVNDWTAYVIFITVIGGIGRIEGPILGTILFSCCVKRCRTLDRLPDRAGSCGCGDHAVCPQRLWGLLSERFHIQLFPIARRVTIHARPGDDISSKGTLP